MEFKEIIKKHLDKMALQDKNFAERYGQSQKTLDGCISYIYQQARKQAKGQCVAIEDNIVFGWAAHYYQEDDIVPDTTVKAEIKPIKAIVKDQPKDKYKEMDMFAL